MKLSPEIRAHEQQLLERIRHAHANGQHKKADYWQRRYLQSLDARRVAVDTANRSMKPHARRPESELLGIAKALDPRSGTKEPVDLWLQEKHHNPGELRAIMNFGLESRALHALVIEVLKARSNLFPFQFASQGTGGRDGALKMLQATVRSGADFAVATDIRDYFPSLGANQLGKILQLPKEVIEHVLVSGGLNLQSKDPWIHHCCISKEFDAVSGGCIEKARRGIPQGSAASSVVAEIVLASVIAEIPKYGIVINFADDLVVLVDHPDKAASMRTALNKALQAAPVGPLTPKTLETFGPGDSFDYLGYRVTLLENDCRLEPSAYNVARFKKEFPARVAKAEKQGIHEARALHRYVNGWTSAFHLWEGAEEHRDFHLAAVKALIAQLDNNTEPA